MLPHIFINEAVCEQFLSGVRNYRKQWDENLLLFRPEPAQDSASHPAGVLRYLAAVDDQMTNITMPHQLRESLSGFPQIGV